MCSSDSNKPIDIWILNYKSIINKLTKELGKSYNTYSKNNSLVIKYDYKSEMEGF